MSIDYDMPLIVSHIPLWGMLKYEKHAKTQQNIKTITAFKHIFEEEDLINIQTFTLCQALF